MLQKQAEKNYLCSLTDKRKTMKHTNPQVEQMTSFIVMDVLERANELQKQGVLHFENIARQLDCHEYKDICLI